jgi:hypothetical protein
MLVLFLILFIYVSGLRLLMKIIYACEIGKIIKLFSIFVSDCGEQDVADQSHDSCFVLLFIYTRLI